GQTPGQQPQERRAAVRRGDPVTTAQAGEQPARKGCKSWRRTKGARRGDRPPSSPTCGRSCRRAKSGQGRPRRSANENEPPGRKPPRSRLPLRNPLDQPQVEVALGTPPLLARRDVGPEALVQGVGVVGE